MGLLPIRTSEADLRQPSEKVRNSREGRLIARTLQQVLDKHNRDATKGSGLPTGIGLAACQLGIYKQVCIINVGTLCILMNPAVVAIGGDWIRSTEGCLSMPGIYLDTWRHGWVDVATLNLGPSRRFGDFSVLGTSRAIATQHEIAHCYGLTIRDFTEERSLLVATGGA